MKKVNFTNRKLFIASIAISVFFMSVLLPKQLMSQNPTILTVISNGQNAGSCMYTNTTSNSIVLRITAKGGGGGNGYAESHLLSKGSTGATMTGQFILGPGETILCVAGGKGGSGLNTGTIDLGNGGGGGGGSGVVNITTNTLLILAAGGTGAPGREDEGNGLGGSISTSGSGDGGNSLYSAGGGGLVSSGTGDNSNGVGCTLSFGTQVSLTGISAGGPKCTLRDGGAGGSGMGGGGGATDLGGGGGGHTGGFGGSLSFGPYTSASSYNTGLNQINTNGLNNTIANDGLILIKCLSGNCPTVTGTPATTPLLVATNTNPCPGTAVTLSIGSGNLLDNDNWVWYSGSCGGTYVGQGSSMVVSPTDTTTYFARGEGGCTPYGSCGQITINTGSGVSIEANPPGPICAGTPVAFTASLINLISPSYQWYKNNNVVGINNALYTDSSWVNNDEVKVVTSAINSCVLSGSNITVIDNTDNATSATSFGPTLSTNSERLATLFTTPSNANLNLKQVTIYLDEINLGSSSNGNIDVKLFATSAGLPTGTALGSQSIPIVFVSGSYETFNFGSIALLSNTTYAIVVRLSGSSGGNEISWEKASTYTTNSGFIFNSNYQSSDNGITWNSISSLLTFQLQCDVVATPQSYTSNIILMDVLPDNTVPTITCPMNDTVYTSSSQCNATVITPDPATNDNCSVTKLTWQLTGATTGISPSIGINNLSNATFNKGVTTVHYYVEDFAGNKDSCSFVITVLDSIAPMILCPSDTSMNAPISQCIATLATANPVFSDNCTVSKLTWEMTGATTAISPLTGFNYVGFPALNSGITTVTYTVEDDDGITNSCFYLITVQVPEINVKGNGVDISDGDNTPSSSDFTDLPISQNKTFVIQNTGTSILHISGVTISGLNPSEFVVINQPDSSVAVGDSTTFTILFTPTSNGLRSATMHISNDDCNESDYDIALQGTGACIAPNILCPGPIVVFTSGACSQVVNYTTLSTGLPTPDITYSFSGATSGNGTSNGSGGAFNIGINSVLVFATNYCGSNSCGFEITVFDNESPSINCPSTIVSCTPVVNYTLTATDNCGIPNMTYSHPSGSSFPAGATTVTVTATDASGNADTCIFQVVVNSPSSGSSSVFSCGPYTWVENNNTTYTVFGIYTATFSNAAGCDSIHHREVNFLPTGPGVYLNAKTILTGPYVSSAGLMHDSLRVNNLIPLTEPYSSSPYNKTPIGEAGGETVTPAILAMTGNQAIVDWIFIELRNAAFPSIVVANKRALLRRDGSIVSNTDGSSPVLFTGVSGGNYYVSIKHRNHLGVMTANAFALNTCSPTSIDFSTLSTVYTIPFAFNAPRKTIGNIGVLWAGDANNNKKVKYNGIANDKDFLLTAVGGAANANSLLLTNVYREEDVNMDGKVRYNGADNDRVVIVNTIGVLTPNNIVSQHTPN